jgi:hypothetical protein
VEHACGIARFVESDTEFTAGQHIEPLEKLKCELGRVRTSLVLGSRFDRSCDDRSEMA